MTISAANFKLRYTEFDSVDDARVEIFLDDAALEISESIWGTLYSRGVYALTAHLLTLNDKSAAGGGSSTVGPVTSRAVGDVSVSFGLAAVKSKSDEYLGSTLYGSEYLRLKGLICHGAIAIT